MEFLLLSPRGFFLTSTVSICCLMFLPSYCPFFLLLLLSPSTRLLHTVHCPLCTCPCSLLLLSPNCTCYLHSQVATSCNDQSIGDKWPLLLLPLPLSFTPSSSSSSFPSYFFLLLHRYWFNLFSPITLIISLDSLLLMHLALLFFFSLLFSASLLLLFAAIQFLLWYGFPIN